jgi:hypothetical protein
MHNDSHPRVSSDGNGGHNINVQGREWKRLIAVISLLLALAGSGITNVIETVSEVVRNAPRQDYRITQAEGDIDDQALDIESIHQWMVKVDGTLVRLADVLEHLEARMESDQ